MEDLHFPLMIHSHVCRYQHLFGKLKLLTELQLRIGLTYIVSAGFAPATSSLSGMRSQLPDL